VNLLPSGFELLFLPAVLLGALGPMLAAVYLIVVLSRRR
jgi:hypothetical protein